MPYGHPDPYEALGEIVPNRVYTFRQARELLMVSEPTFRKWLQTGRVRGAQLGHEWRFLGSQLIDALMGKK